MELELVMQLGVATVVLLANKVHIGSWSCSCNCNAKQAYILTVGEVREGGDLK